MNGNTEMDTSPNPIPKALPLLFIFLTFVYLCWGGGMVSDDFTTVRFGKDLLSGNSFNMRGNYRNMPIAYIFMQFPTELVSYKFSFVLDFLKAVYLFLGFLALKRFLQIYFTDKVSAFFSFFFLFWPNHGSTVHWLIGQHLILSFCFYAYAYSLLDEGKLKAAVFMAFVASFLSYSSPAAAASFFFLAIYRRGWKRAFLILVPNLIYTAYYLASNYIFGNYESRVNVKVGIGGIIKNFVIQIGTLLDANLGPSFLFKIFYCLNANTLISLLVAFALLLALKFSGFFERAFWRSVKLNKEFVAFISIAVVMWTLMFTVTGRYPQLAFNLGNRTVAISCLLSVFVFLMLPYHFYIKNIFLSAIVVAIVGLSQHWSDWQANQGNTIEKMADNNALKNLEEGETLFVSGNHYSKLGPFAHLEFLSEDWVISGIYSGLFKRTIDTQPLSSRMVLKDGQIYDIKYDKFFKTNDTVIIYDSKLSQLKRLRKEDLPLYIKSLARDKRHWVQMIENEVVNDFLVKIIPRIKYAF